MNEQAVTLLQQGRSFARAGNVQRAAELLRRAHLLAGNDDVLQSVVLEELIAIADAAGLQEEAAVWSDQLAEIETRRTAEVTIDDLSYGVSLPRAKRSGGGRIALYASLIGTAVVVAGIGYSLWPAAPRPNASDVESPPAAPVTSPPTVAGPEPTTVPLTPAAEREQQIRDGVGLLLWMQHYEGMQEGRDFSLDLVLASGSAFAIDASGVMLTNRHVTSARDEVTPPDSSPPAYIKVGKPVLRACFGPEETRHYPVTILHESPTYDVAIIQVERHFDRPFELAWDASPAMGDAVVAAGYPGIVLDISRQTNAAFAESRLLDLVRTGRYTYRDQYPPDAFSPVLTRGIISSPRREMDGATVHLFDAHISPGNSGGPLLIEGTTRVIGIVTIGGINQASGYNYALALPQVRAEIERYLRP